MVQIKKIILRLYAYDSTKKKTSKTSFLHKERLLVSRWWWQLACRYWVTPAWYLSISYCRMPFSGEFIFQQLSFRQAHRDVSSLSQGRHLSVEVSLPITLLQVIRLVCQWKNFEKRSIAYLVKMWKTLQNSTVVWFLVGEGQGSCLTADVTMDIVNWCLIKMVC